MFEWWRFESWCFARKRLDPEKREGSPISLPFDFFKRLLKRHFLPVDLEGGERSNPT